MRVFSSLVRLLSWVTACAVTLKPFITAGCSHFLEDTLSHRKLWLSYCTTHDLDYWQVGTGTQRESADRTLKDSVRAVSEPAIATLMLVGVRVSSTPYLPTSSRCRRYGWTLPSRIQTVNRSGNTRREQTTRIAKTKLGRREPIAHYA